jgi:hypothetical protein
MHTGNGSAFHTPAKRRSQLLLLRVMRLPKRPTVSLALLTSFVDRRTVAEFGLHLFQHRRSPADAAASLLTERRRPRPIGGATANRNYYDYLCSVCLHTASRVERGLHTTRQPLATRRRRLMCTQPESVSSHRSRGCRRRRGGPSDLPQFVGRLQTPWLGCCERNVHRHKRTVYD